MARIVSLSRVKFVFPNQDVIEAQNSSLLPLKFKLDSRLPCSSLGTNKTESAKGLSTSSAVQNQLSPTSQEQQIQSQLLQTENDQEDNEGDLTLKMMSTTGTISVSRIQLKD